MSRSVMNSLLTSAYRQEKRDERRAADNQSQQLLEEHVNVMCQEYEKRLQGYAKEAENLSMKSLEMINEYKTIVEGLYTEYVPKLQEDSYYDVALKNIEKEMSKMFEPFEEVKHFVYKPRIVHDQVDSRIIQNQINLLKKEIREKKDEEIQLRKTVEKEKSAYESLKKRLHRVQSSDC